MNTSPRRLTERIRRYQLNIRSRKTLFLIIAGSLVGGGVVILIVRRLVYPYATPMWIAGTSLAALGALYGILVWLLVRTRLGAMSAEIENLERKARIADVVGPTRSTPSGLGSEREAAAGTQYFSRLVTINVGNLSDYYTLVKVHTNKQLLGGTRLRNSRIRADRRWYRIRPRSGRLS
jgi:hypothetical protein